VAPSQRFRIEQWLPTLEAHDIMTDLVPFADAGLMKVLHQPGRFVAKAVAGLAALVRRAVALTRAGRYDAILIHRAAFLFGPAALERAVFTAGRPVIFDFDDAIHLLHTTGANRWLGWLKFPGKTAALCRMSDLVVAGNNHLAEFARRHNPRVEVVPSSVDTVRFVLTPRRPANDRVVLGWTGSSTSQTYLEAFAPILGEIVRRCGVEVRVHSDRRPDLPGVAHVWRPWSPATEAAEVAAFDIGIMPLPDDPWTRGKCAMKALIYMAAGIPVVCSAVGTNREVVRHGENGLLATTADDWITAVSSLTKDPALRSRLGAAGRRTVEDGYSASVCGDRFARLIREAVDRRRRAGAAELALPATLRVNG
jgi:glycosyltransferase involved in cell wall biosynthesis